MAGSQDYGLNFLIKQYGQENLQAIAAAIGDAARKAKDAKEQSDLWGAAIRKAADLAGVSIKGVNDQIKQQSKDLEEARRATERLAQEEKKRYEDGLRFLRNREANEARDAANRAARQRAEDASFRQAFGGGSGGGGDTGGGGSLIGRVGGRVLGAEVLGRGLGIPGGGFIGSQLAYGSGLSGGAALGLGAAAAGAIGLYATTKAVEDVTKYAQEQANLSKELGISAQQTQILGRVSEISGVQVSGLFGILKKMNESLLAGGPAAKKTQEALNELGLNSGIAFQKPQQQLESVVHALNAFAEGADRDRVVVKLLGEEGRGLLPLVDSLERLSQRAKASGAIISDDDLKKLKQYREDIEVIGLAWDRLKQKLAEKAVGVIEFVIKGYRGLTDNPSGIPSISDLLPDNQAKRAAQNATTVPARPPVPDVTRGIPSGFERSQGDRIKSDIERLRRAGLTPLEQARREVSEYGKLRDESIESYKSTQDRSFYDAALGYDKQRLGAEGQVKFQQELERFRDLTPASKLTTEALAREGEDFQNKYKLISGTREFQERKGAITGAQQIVGDAALADLGAKIGEGFLKHLESEGAKTISDIEKGRAYLVGETTREVANRDKEARGAFEESTAASRLGAVTREGFSRYGLTPIQIAGREYQAARQNALESSLPRAELLGKEIESRQNALSYLQGIEGPQSEKEQEAIQAAMEQKRAELQAINNDYLAKSTEAINKFNDAVDKAAEAIRSEFASGFESIVLGAQRGGKRGLTGALRGFGEQQEGIILRNIGEKVFDQIKGTLGGVGGSLPKGIQDILKGTILQAPVDKIKDNTDQMKTDISAIRADIEGKGASGGGAGGGGGSGSSPLGNILGSLKGPGGILSGQSQNSPYVFYNNDSGGDSGGSGGGSGGGSSGTGISIGGRQISGAAIKEIASIGAAAALGAHGISDLIRGGAKNTIGGIGEIAGAAALVDPDPISKLVLTGVAVVSGLVSSLFGDSRQGRGAQISKNLFGQQYQAPQAITLSEYGGGYSDFGIDGSVRTSNFSPYPTVSNSFLDVPRRTVVPGHTISSFGGTDAGTPGAIVSPASPRVAGNAGAPTYHLTIQALNAQSFLDNADHIVDAFHRGVSNQGHPVIQAIGSQLGLR